MLAHPDHRQTNLCETYVEKTAEKWQPLEGIATTDVMTLGLGGRPAIFQQGFITFLENTLLE